MNEIFKRTLLSCTMAASFAAAAAQGDALVTVTARPDNSARNSSYVNARTPLLQQVSSNCPWGAYPRQGG